MAEDISGAPVSDEAAVADEMAVATDYAAYQPTAYQDGSQGQTPITAASLNKTEQGLAAASAQVVELRDSVSRVQVGGIEAGDTATKAMIGSVSTANPPQPVVLKVESTQGAYALIASSAGLSLWSYAQGKSVWNMRPSA